MSRDGKPLAGCKPADCKSVLPACEEFDTVLRRVIRNPKNGPITHAAAECLFAVRKLENAITAASSMGESVVIPPIDKEDL